jgi:PBSX family phage terminase large subunit
VIEVNIDKDVYLECYHHLLEPNDVDIEILFGGRDSGKSKFVAQILTEEAMAMDYFRCLLIKETHESIKDAQWQMIHDNATSWGVDQLFKFKTSPLSIDCVNGNTFATRGMDKPGKIRSFTNPSHAWAEEANQIGETSFITLLTGLRNEFGKVKMWLTLNPEANTPDFNEFWLYKTFFTKYRGEKIFTGEIVNTVKRQIHGRWVEEQVILKFRITHTTYHDNPYVSAQRIAFHESLASLNPHWYRVFTMGLWGNQENDSPWLFAWSRDQHVSPVELFATRSQILYLSWDFNRNPHVCTVIQWPDESEVQIIEVIKIPNVGTEGVCEVIIEKYLDYLYMVTGDYSGDTVSSLYKEQVTNYTVIKKDCP